MRRPPSDRNRLSESYVANFRPGAGPRRPRGGFTKVPNELVDSPSLTPYEKLALIKLWSHMRGNRHEVWPSLSSLAKGMGASIDTARRTMESLIAKGYVTRKSRG